MRLLGLLLTAAAAAAAPSALAAPLVATKGKVIPGKWIVVMKEDYQVGGEVGKKGITIESLVAPRHTYNLGRFKAYAMDASDETINKIAELDDVAFIEPDTMVETATTSSEADPPWGLARISSRTPDARAYVYDDSAGEGTYTYVIDSGVLVEHPEFGGRARWGASLVAGSRTYGVAKKTNIVAVKVLNAAGAGPVSQIIAGIQWVVDDAKSKNRINKSVANMSLGSIAIGNSSMSLAAGAAVEQGLFIAAAAGNSQTPVEFFSPAQYPTLCTVAASARDDARAYFSNYGNGVDLFAPGVDVVSTYNNGSTATLSGTSMAAPHVAGLAAYLLALEGDRDPVALCERMQDLATKDVVSDAMSPNNMVAFNGAPQDDGNKLLALLNGVLQKLDKGRQ